MSFIKCAIYDTATGAIKRYAGSSPEDVANQVGYCEEFYLNCPETATHIINDEPVTIVPEVVPPALEEVKEAKLKELAANRYREETGGITAGTATIATDRDSQALVTGAYVSLQQGFVSTVNWKGENEWVTLTLAELEPIAQAVGQHIQACFTRESQLAAQVAAAETVEAVNSVVW